MYQLVLVAVILCILFKVLNVNNTPAKSIFYSANAKFLEDILKHTPALAEPYIPTRLWGFSGHVQTIIQGVISRIYCPLVNGKRYYFTQPDLTTVTFDLYQPKEQHSLNGDYTIAMCPGIGNTSESVYIRRVVEKSTSHGYRVAVLNHVGALKSVPITSPRIFNYGNTKDYGGMVNDLRKRFPGTKLICVGFSMGGNIVTKYLGEESEAGRLSSRVIAGISACQGYDAVEASKMLLQWENCRRLYFFAMTENMKAILRRWQKQLFGEELKRERGIVEREVWYAATLVEVDEAYTRKIWGSESVEEYYRSCSSINYVDDIKIPMVLINSSDDPIVPPPLVTKIKKKIAKKSNFIHIEQQFGGHLGFYEGGFLIPNNSTWLDRIVVSLTDSLVTLNKSGKNREIWEDDEEDLSLMDSAVSSGFNTSPIGSDEELTTASSNEESSDASFEDASPLITKRMLRAPEERTEIRRARFVCRKQTMHITSLTPRRLVSKNN